MNAQLKIAKLEAETARMIAAKEFTLAVLDNPAVDLLAGTLLIETWAKSNDAGGWWGETLELGSKTALETALNFVCIAKALGGGAGVGELASKLIAKVAL